MLQYIVMTTSSFSLFSGWWVAGFLGANHASVLYSGNRGAVAYENAVAAADETSFGWIEYGNPHSTMGNGDLMDHKVDFVIEGKSVFDWMDHDDAIVETVAYTADGAPACVGATPCGPYYIYPTDLGSYPSGAKLGVQIGTGTSDVYFFVEHRTDSTLGTAALITWSKIDNYGMTGRYGNTVLVDCTPGTTSFFDAGCAPGTSIDLDIGTASTPLVFTVQVGQLSGDGTLPVSISSSSTSAPTYSPAPSPMPTEATCTADGWCCQELLWPQYGMTFKKNNEMCCDGHCTYTSYGAYGTGYQMVWASCFSKYYVLAAAETCHTDCSITSYGKFTVSDMQALCVDTEPPVMPPVMPPVLPPVPSPTALPPSSGWKMPTQYHQHVKLFEQMASSRVDL